MTLLSIDQSDDRPLYRQLATSVRRAVADGSLAPGQQLPATRDAATALGVNAETVQRAYRVLADDGIVVSRVGRGTRVRDDVDPSVLGVRDDVQALVAKALRHGISQDQLVQMIRDC